MTISRRAFVFGALAGAMALAGCNGQSRDGNLSESFKLGSAFRYEDMEYTIQSIVPTESIYKKYGIHNGLMDVAVACKSLKDGAEPDLERDLTMYDSDGQENSYVVSFDKPESSVGKLKKGAEASYTLVYGYDYDEPWYELTLKHADESASFKFSIDPDTLETSVVD